MITKEILFNEYTEKMNNILDECDWKTNFTSNDVCGVVYSVFLDHSIELKISPMEFHLIYKHACNGFWTVNTTIREITDVCYDLLVPQYTVQ